MVWYGLDKFYYSKQSHSIEDKLSFLHVLLRKKENGRQKNKLWNGYHKEGTMSIKTEIENFLDQKTLAIVGVSRNRKKFSNKVYRDLKSKGFRLFIVNPNAESIESEHSYPNLAAIPEKVDRALIIVPRSETEKVVKDAVRLGISHIWIQQGAESEKAVNFCKENGIKVIPGECILMFAEPTVFYHRLHRWVWNLTK